VKWKSEKWKVKEHYPSRSHSPFC